jgi:intein-encoded DNA endonuclease-like protein
VINRKEKTNIDLFFCQIDVISYSSFYVIEWPKRKYAIIYHTYTYNESPIHIHFYQGDNKIECEKNIAC